MVQPGRGGGDRLLKKITPKDSNVRVLSILRGCTVNGGDERNRGHQVARSVRGRVSICDEVQGLQIGWDAFCLALHREHVVR